MGVLEDKLTSPLGGALSIFLLGWIFGWLMYRGKSAVGATLAHALNNLFNAG